MGELTFQYTDHLVTESCCNCGVLFGMPIDMKSELRRSKRTFYCPNGHGNVYAGKTEAEKLREEAGKLREELEREIRRREMAERESAMEAKRAAKATNKLERIKKRVQNGVCPCCNRTFQNLARHMATKHPEQATP
jgi:hypothetical protein